MKETAVEWLQERINIGLTYEQEVLFEGLFDQAKELERQQIIGAHIKGFYSPPFGKSRKGEAEQYYNETFKSE